MQICSLNCQFYLLVLVVTTFVFIFSFLREAIRAVGLVLPVLLFFCVCCAVWFVMEQIKTDR